MAEGCIYIVGHTKRWNTKTRRYEMRPLECHKLCEPNSNLCPRHRLVSEESAKQPRGQQYGYERGT